MGNFYLCNFYLGNFYPGKFCASPARARVCVRVRVTRAAKKREQRAAKKSKKISQKVIHDAYSERATLKRHILTALKGSKIMEINFIVSCPNHPRYKGLRKPRGDCSICWSIYHARKDSGTKERRIRVSGRGKLQTEKLDTTSVNSLINHVTDYRADDNGESVFKEVARNCYEKNREKHEA